MNDDKPEDQYSEQETAERLDRALKRSFNMPHKPHKPRSDKPPADKAGRKKKGR